MESPFEVLGLAPDADDEEIRQAYKRRVKEAHPDHGGSAAEFQRVRAAYEELRSGERPDGTNGERGIREGAGVGEGGGADDGSTDGEEPDEEPRPRVEYLNYDVLDDHGWSLDDEDLFEKAAAAGLDPTDYGRLRVPPDESLLEAAEGCGFTWPYACRGGACANCAVAVTEGDLSTPVDHILPPEFVDRGIRLSCVGVPTTDEMRVVYNVKHLPGLDDLRLPPHPFTGARGSD